MIEQYSYGINTDANPNNNVIDRYKEWTAAEVRADLDTRRSEMVCIFENIGYNINIACSIRSNNAFCGKEVYITNRRRFDPRGAVGMKKYTKIFHADTIQEVADKLRPQGYTFFAVDNIMEYHPKNFWDVDYPAKSAFIFGSESEGISREALDLADDMVYIKMDGAVRSLNVACAATCVMAEYTRQHRKEV